MIEEILDTEAKVRIMKFLSKFPDMQFQAIEVARRSGVSVSRASECLKDLADKGILESRKIGKGYLFKVNKSNYLTRIILETFEKEKGFVEIIAKDFVSRVKTLGKIESIVLFGSALKELKIGSDIDFLIVSEYPMDESIIYKIDSELTEKYGFPVSSILMTVEELKRKSSEGFVIDVIASGKILFGKNLEDVIWSEKKKRKKQKDI